MEKTLKKVVKTGYGLGLLSLKEGKRAAMLLKAELNLNDDESLRLAKELVDDSTAVSKEVLGTVQKYVEKALVRSKVVDKHELSFAKRIVRSRGERLKRKKIHLARVKEAALMKRE